MGQQALPTLKRYQTDTGAILTQIFADENLVILDDETGENHREYYEMDKFAEKIVNGELQEFEAKSEPCILNEMQQEVLKRKLAYVHTLNEIVNDPKRHLAPTTPAAYEAMKEILLKRQPELVYKNLPGRSTICSYWQRWVTSGFDDNSLAPKKRKTSLRLDLESELFLEELICTDFCKGTYSTVIGCYDAYKDSVEKSAKPLKLASYSTYRRRIRRLSEYEEKLKNPNLHESERASLLRTLLKKVKLTYVGERIELDKLCLNFCLIDDETNLPTEKLGIYVAFDAYSRYPIGIVLEFGQSENKESATRLVQSIFESDKFLPASIKPQDLVTDNGPGFNNSVLQSVASNLGANLIYNPAYCPAMKPFVESFNNTLRKKFFQGYKVNLKDGSRVIGIPGYFPKRTKNDYAAVDLKKQAKMTVSDFIKHFNRFLQEYTLTKHSQTGETPAERFNRSLVMRSKKDSTYDEVFAAFHVYTKPNTRKLQDRGYVYCFNHYYSSLGLKRLFIQMKTYGSGTPEVTVLYNPFDIRHITVIGQIPKTGQVIKEVVPIKSIEEWPHPVSVEEMHGKKPKAITVYLEDKGFEYTNEVHSELHKVKTRRNRSGKAVSSFEDNNSNHLSALDRINASHHKVTKERTAYDANLTCELPEEGIESDVKRRNEGDLWD
ncbi:integrase catalytic domain-containing protein [Shewanella spartinae]|uniref:integrase catalytic domain-containing protein n=1 Tax=Shewanella spartinae TaxID=2864205 RepID=UPI001C65C870|nr:transposase family protein [Shewanella spartinae]QYJ95704.1 transposase family protein [Shewanella spartinae]